MRIAKLIFDILLSLYGLFASWDCMSQGLEYLFYYENFDMAAFKICASILNVAAALILLIVFVPLDIQAISKNKKNDKENGDNAQRVEHKNGKDCQ